VRYYFCNRKGLQGGIPPKGGDAMGVYQSLKLMISFATLIVLVLSFQNRK